MRPYPSIFNEALAPITPGPSSSNTAGPLRISRTCAELFGDPITDASIEMSDKGSFTFTYFGMRSDLGFIGGLLKRDSLDSRFFKAYEDAEAAGIRVRYGYYEDLPAEPGEYVRLVLENKDMNKKMVFCGASVGGGGFYLESVDGCACDIRGYNHEVLLFTQPCGEVMRHNMLKAILMIAGEPEDIKISDSEQRTLFEVKLADSPSEEQIKAFKNIEGLLNCCICSPRHSVSISKRRKPVFSTPAGLIKHCEEQGKQLWEAACDYEMSLSGWTQEQVLEYAGSLWDIIEESERKGREQGLDLHQLLGPKAPLVQEFYDKDERRIPGGVLDRAVPASLSIMEYAGSSGTIVCIPTGGASGIVPGCIMGLCKEKNLSREEAVKGLLVSGLFGVFMAETDYFGGWGCQAEIGCGVGMAAAGLVAMMGGSARQAERAAVMGIQSLLGLVCDSVCGQSQVPCYIRNMTGTATALVCANGAMAGLDSLIPLEEMVEALIRIGRASRSIKLNSMGANGTPTGIKLEREELERQKKIVDEKLGKH